MELKQISALSGREAEEIIESSKSNMHFKNAKLEYKDSIGSLMAEHHLKFQGKTLSLMMKLYFSSVLNRVFNIEWHKDLSKEKKQIKRKYIYELNLSPELKENLRIEYLNELDSLKEKYSNSKQEYKDGCFILLNKLKQEKKELKINSPKQKLRDLIKLEKSNYKLEKKEIAKNKNEAEKNIKQHKYLTAQNGDIYKNYKIDISPEQLKTFKNDYKIQKVKTNKKIKELKLEKLDPETKAKTILNLKQNIFLHKSKFSYEGIYQHRKNSFKINYFDNIVLLKKQFEKEKTEKLQLIKNTKSNEINYKKLVNSKLSLLKENFSKDKKSLYREFFNKNLTYKSLRNQKKALRFNFLSSKREISFLDENKELRVDLKNLGYNYHQNKIKEKLTFQSNIAKLSGDVPTTKNPIMKYLAALFSFVFPGIGELINGQYKKAIIKLLISGFVILLVMYSFGIGNIEGNGIMGLISLGYSESIVFQKDAKFFMIEGTISLLFLICTFLYITISSVSSYKIAISLEKGSRTKTWLETKNYFKNVGYPIGTSIPAAIMVFFVIIIPLVTTLLLAFTNYGSNNPGNFQWNGIGQFKKIFTADWADAMKSVVIWTFIWTIGTWLTSFLIAFVLSLASNHERMKGKVFFRMIYVLPWAIPGFITILLFRMCFLPGSILSNLFSNQGFLTDAKYSKIAVLMIQMWSGYCVNFVLITGILQSISKDLYEAAEIDGANSAKKTWKVTIPLVIYQMTPILVGQFMACFNNFTIIYLYNNGGPSFLGGNIIGAGATDTISSLIYKLISGRSIAMASALNVVVSIFIVGASITILMRSKSVKEGIN